MDKFDTCFPPRRTDVDTWANQYQLATAADKQLHIPVTHAHDNTWADRKQSFDLKTACVFVCVLGLGG